MKAARHGLWASFVRWFDSWQVDQTFDESRPGQVDWLRVLPFVAMHFGCLFVLSVGVSPVAVGVAVGLYFARMFAITAFYHRFFSHRAFKTSRPVQFLGALLGASSIQRGPLWWAAHHRLHHRHSDRGSDAHSPRQHGLVWSHVGWILDRVNFRTRVEMIPDFARFPELRFLDRFDLAAPALLAATLYGVGELLAAFAPSLGTSGAQLLVWGFLVSTIVLYHVTFSINSLAHLWGTRRYETSDDSRNNVWLALLTLGEGWHNNHHRYPASVRQGFRWWEIDVSYYVLRVLSWFGLVWDLRPVPARVLKRPDVNADLRRGEG